MRPEIIAEIGSSHCGSIAKATELIAAAREAGADCAKFQWIIADEILHPLRANIPLAGKTLYQHFKDLERGIDFYQRLKEICAAHNIAFLCTPFGVQSARLLYQIGIDRIKIASPELNHFPFLEEISGYGKVVLASTGVSRLSDIEEALEHLCNVPVVLLHCVSSYPAAASEYNLCLLPLLATLFGTDVGVSDHSKEAEIVPAIATALRARYIEKHITLDNNGSGLDDSMALEAKDFRRMVNTVHSTAALMEKEKVELNGDYKHPRLPAELFDNFGHKAIHAVLGNGIKTLTASEEKHYYTTRRSLIAGTDIKAGDVISRSSIAVLRAVQHTPGLHPRYLKRVCGCKALHDIPSGKSICWEDILYQEP